MSDPTIAESIPPVCTAPLVGYINRGKFPTARYEQIESGGEETDPRTVMEYAQFIQAIQTHGDNLFWEHS